MWIRQTIFRSYELMGSGLLWLCEFIFEAGGMLEHVISRVCILGIPISPLGVAGEAPGLRTASAAEQNCCWCHAPASTVGLGVAEELLPPAFPVAAEPGAGAAPGSRLLPLWETGTPCLGPAETQPSCLPQLLVHVTVSHLYQRQQLQPPPNLAMQCGSSPLFPWSQELLPASKTQQKPELLLCTRERV